MRKLRKHGWQPQVATDFIRRVEAKAVGQDVLARVDAYAERRGLTRSGFLALAASNAIVPLEAAPEDIELREGRYQVRGVPSKGLTFAEIADRAYVMELGELVLRHAGAALTRVVRHGPRQTEGRPRGGLSSTWCRGQRSSPSSRSAMRLATSPLSGSPFSRRTATVLRASPSALSAMR